MKKERKYLLLLVFLATIIGIIMIYSASSIWAEYKFNNKFHFVILQSMFFLVSIFIMFIISKIDYHIYKKHCNFILLISFILLILVLIPGLGQLKNGSRSWFSLGPVSFQPSEISKIALIIFLSKYISNYQKDIERKIPSIFPVFIIIGLFFSLIILEPDMGSAMVIMLTLCIIIFTSGIKLSFFGFLSLLGIIGLSGLIIMAPYRIKRIVSFINPWLDPLGSGYQIIQSLYAIGPGGLFGLGFGNSIQKQFYLPEPQTDFIFSIICEEFGILGSVIITVLFGLIFYLIVKIALKQTDLFAKFLCFGLGILIILQALLNLCVVVGLIPVTGVTLPFISYGGSSLLVSMASIGIILNISKNK